MRKPSSGTPKFVEFGSQVAGSSRGCATSCHNTIGPRNATFFRDWYAGQKFGEYAVRTGQAPRLIATHETVLSAIPDSRASNLSLAYLYEATGQNDKAEDVWETSRSRRPIVGRAADRAF